MNVFLLAEEIIERVCFIFHSSGRGEQGKEAEMSQGGNKKVTLAVIQCLRPPCRKRILLRIQIHTSASLFCHHKLVAFGIDTHGQMQRIFLCVIWHRS